MEINVKNHTEVLIFHTDICKKNKHSSCQMRNRLREFLIAASQQVAQK